MVEYWGYLDWNVRGPWNLIFETVAISESSQNEKRDGGRVGKEEVERKKRKRKGREYSENGGWVILESGVS